MGRLRTVLCLSSFILSLLITLSSFTAADDAAVMSKLLGALSLAPSGWTATTECCKWKNVSGHVNGRVNIINLASQSLSGILPSDLGSLSRLTALFLQENSFSGPLPSLANLSSLQLLIFDNNKFSSIPAGFFEGLTSLHTLSLSQNLNLAPWTFPIELTQATRLVTLDASNANVIGSLPDIFGSFPSLRDLRLSYNKLTGPLPKSLGRLVVQIIWLDNQLNGLSGTIDLLSSMTDLRQVWLHKNQFTGPIPDLSACTILIDLQLGDNQFIGIVPPSLMSISSLKNISLDNNELQGPYPVFPSSVTTITLGDTNSFCKSTPGPCDSQVTTLLEVATGGHFGIGHPTTGSATTKVDVYAFGVVLEQLITGRKALHTSLPDTTDNSCDLVAWFNKVPITKERIRQAIDETIRPDDEEVMESIYKVAELAVHCTASNRNQRPDMTYAVRTLGPLVEQWIPTTCESSMVAELAVHCTASNRNETPEMTNTVRTLGRLVLGRRPPLLCYWVFFFPWWFSCLPCTCSSLSFQIYLATTSSSISSLSSFFLFEVHTSYQEAPPICTCVGTNHGCVHERKTQMRATTLA
ncbi:putative receptor protein kinase TMK1 [Morella rubra]|uniref:Putative receptor protein kinase TMK1 n=1 Tax=Morella rubra TaxID=262757 RepID=A0A6A1VLA6_9ROSI|nr:putative receptor protein kinase TMK1 [Morella rubra]